MSNPQLSIIICTYNREEELKKCLYSLIEQSYTKKDFEAIIVDNNSTDKTNKIFQDFQKKLTNARYIVEKKQGLSHARNKGFDVSRGKYLVYLDDDVILPKNYISNIKKVINKYNPDILGGPIYPYYTTPKPFWYKDSYETRKYENKSGFSTSCNISGGNFIIKKVVLKKTGKFNIQFGMIGDKDWLGEEREVLEIYRKIIPINKQKVFYDLDCFLNHHVPKKKIKLFYLINRSFIGGRALARIYKKHNIDPKIGKNKQLGLIGKFLNNLYEIGKLTLEDIKNSKEPFDLIEIIRITAFRIGLRIEYLW